MLIFYTCIDLSYTNIIEMGRLGEKEEKYEKEGDIWWDALVSKTHYEEVIPEVVDKNKPKWNIDAYM